MQPEVGHVHDTPLLQVADSCILQPTCGNHSPEDLSLQSATSVHGVNALTTIRLCF